nr:MAG TPA: hypothetical protein [Caudoviricetes sp.]
MKIGRSFKQGVLFCYKYFIDIVFLLHIGYNCFCIDESLISSLPLTC